MANNVTVKFGADVADLTAKRAVASAELKTFQKDLDSLAKSAKGGMTDQLRSQMLAAGDAVAKARAQVAGIDKDLRGFTQTAGHAAGGTSVITRELLTLGREAGRGNFTRMAGSATILAQAMASVAPQALLAAGAVAALVAPIVAVMAAIESAKGDLARFQNDVQLTGNYAGVTGDQFQAMAARVAAASHTGLGTARSALAALLASGRFTGEEMEELGRDSVKMSQLTGESAKQVLADFVRMADGPTQYAEQFNRVHHAWTEAQIEEIDLLEKHGKKSEATALLVKDLTGWLDQQTSHLGPLAAQWLHLGTAIDDAWESFKKAVGGGHTDSEQVAIKSSLLASLEGGRSEPGMPQGADRAKMIASLQREIAALQIKIASDNKGAEAQGKSARATQEANDAYSKASETLGSLHKSADVAAEAVKALHEQIAAIKAVNPSSPLLKDYEAHAAAYDAALKKRNNPEKEKAGPGVVEQWQAEFRQAQVLSANFFEDETKAELAFWQSKIGLTKAGSKEWLEVQGHIYDASKALAHQAYDDNIATLNAQLEAAKNNWTQEQALLAQKLSYAMSVHGQGSKEEEAVRKEQEAAEREHQAQLAEIQRDGANEALAELKSNLDAAKAVREAGARTVESGDRGEGKSNPFLGEVQAAQQIKTLHQQMAAQELADDRTLQAAKAAILEEEIAAAAAAYGKDSAQYAKAVDAKKLADLEWANQQKVLAAQAAQQQIQDQQRIAQAWHATIDPMVSTVGAQFKGLITGTETWNQAIVRIGDQALNLVIQAVEKMAEQWIVSMLTGQAAQRTAAVGQVSSYAGVAGAAGVASMAGAPWPLDMTAPAFGASMAAAALAFSGLASFDRGTNMLPTDMVAQVHEGERIVPAADNRAIISALNGGGGSGAARGSANAGGTVNISMPSLDPRSAFGTFNTARGRRELAKAVASLR